MEPRASLEKLASSICSDVITNERARLLVRDILRKASGMMQGSGPSSAMMSVLEAYELEVKPILKV